MAGRRLLGEVAIVDGQSRVGQTGLVFFETLFDENATSHVALGFAYPHPIPGALEVDDDARREMGVNVSGRHLDFMIGGPELDVDGITTGGEHVPVLRGGEWQV